MWHRRGTLLGALLVAARAAAEPLSPAALLEAVMRRLATVPDSRASFVEEKTVAALAEPVRSQGWLAYRRPGYLEKATTGPVAESLMVDGDRLSLIIAGQQPRLIDLRDEPALAALVDAIRGTLSGDVSTLRRSYAVAMKGDVGAWTLTLTPTTPPLTDMLRQVVVEGAAATLRRVETLQPNGDRSVMTISVPDQAVH